MLVVAGVPATAAFAQESSEEQPGATFAGVVGVQGAEVEGEVAQRSLDRRLADAESNASKAAVVAGETEDARQQLSELRERRETLDRRYESGEITRGEYRSKLARIGAQIRTLERRLNATAAAAEGLPEETLRERGVNASAIDELRRNASEMAGGEVAEAARGIGGADTGKGLAGDPGPPEDAGPPADAGNGNDGPPEDAGPGDGDDEDADDRGEGAAGKPNDRGNLNGSETAGENGEAGANGTGDADGAEDRGNGNRTTGAGESDGNRTDDGDPPGSQDDADDSGDDRGNANHADGGADGSTDAGDGNGSGDGSDGANAGGGADSDDADGGDERRGNGNGSPDDGTATPTESPGDDGGDRSVDDGWYLTLR
ncbi:hypothetical protein GCM10009000_020190 [Halobacterium noricense]